MATVDRNGDGNVGTQRSVDVAVVGGGLGGLVAAATAARAGLRVVLLERASRLGGRARSDGFDGFTWNQGPHAFYRQGAALRVLDGLGVRVAGGVPEVSGSLCSYAGALHAMPVGALSLLSTSLFAMAERVEAGRAISRLSHMDPDGVAGVPLAVVLDRLATRPRVRALCAALCRVATYAADESQDASAAIRQVAMALAGNVVYADDGWQRTVDAVAVLAEAAGARLMVGHGVEAVTRAEDGALFRLRVDGHELNARSVILAGSPRVAAALAPEEARAALERAARASLPVRAACLDVALSRLPRPGARFALGLDTPTYLSVHSATAALAPDGGAVVHVARYLREDDGHAGVEAGLWQLLEQVQPGARALVVRHRYLPAMVVSHALATGPLSGRPGVLASGVPGLYVAGDWVGAEGMLCDASLASAEEAARHACAHVVGGAVDSGRSAA